VLWTILSLRWPRLAEYLEREPHIVKNFGAQEVPKEIPEDIRPLFSDQNVLNIIKGRAEGIDADIGDESSIISLRGYL
jgi:hypothetical protein